MGKYTRFCIILTLLFIIGCEKSSFQNASTAASEETLSCYQGSPMIDSTCPDNSYNVTAFTAICVAGRTHVFTDKLCLANDGYHTEDDGISFISDYRNIPIINGIINQHWNGSSWVDISGPICDDYFSWYAGKCTSVFSSNKVLFTALLSSASQETGAKITIIGDDISYQSKIGVGYLTYLQKSYSELQFINLSQNGLKSADLSGVLSSVSKSQLYLISVGLNDVFSLVDEGVFLQNIKNTGESLLNTGGKIFVVSLWPSFYSSAEEKERIKSFNDSLELLCEENNFFYIDTYETLSNVTNDQNIGSIAANGYLPSSLKGKILYFQSIILDSL